MVDPYAARVARILSAIAPTDAAYASYRHAAREYLLARRYAREDGRTTGPFVAASLRRSALFRREMLVIIVKDAWLVEHAPDNDALALPGDMSVSFARPPAACVPESRPTARSRAARAVLEHEFVHVAQMIAGRFRWPDGVAGLLPEFETRLRGEYEAHFLQHARFRGGIADGVNMEQWCLLRAYQSAVEHLLVHAARLDAPDAVVNAVLAEVPTTTRSVFDVYTPPSDDLEWLMRSARLHVGTAVQVIAARWPHLEKSGALAVALAWSGTRAT